MKKLSIIVGLNIKRIRKENKLSQSELADIVGVKYQQIQKYEKGVNNISATKIYKISKTLNVSLESFFVDSDV